MNQTADILVVDDNSTNRLKLRMAVRALGYKVRAAENGAVALEALRETRYDAVLLDIMMPEVDGFDVLRAMKGDENLRDIPVIVISALDTETESVVKAIKPIIRGFTRWYTLPPPSFTTRDLTIQPASMLHWHASVSETGNLNTSVTSNC